jgi:hypothetical protein
MVVRSEHVRLNLPSAAAAPNSAGVVVVSAAVENRCECAAPPLCRNGVAY